MTITKKQSAAVNQPMAVANVARNGKLEQWNVLIYMAADNNLREECVWALTEILRVGPIPEVNVIAQLDSGSAINRYDFRKLRGKASSSDASVGQGRYDTASPPSRKAGIKLNAIAEELSPKFIPRQDNGHRSEEAFMRRENASDLEMIKNFIHSVIGKPASVPSVKSPSGRRLAISAPEVKPYNIFILSGHGSGAVGDFFNSDNPPSALSIPGLGSILKPIAEQLGRKIDVLGMDSCLMSMAEVCYELRDSVKFMVGAEGFEQNTGWPYHNILAALQADVTMKLKDFACAIVKEYIHYYSDYTVAGVSVDHAACDLSQLSILRDAVTKLAQVLQDKLSYQEVENAILLAHWRAQSYKFEQYVDLWDFCDLLARSCDDAEIEQACKEAKESVEKCVLISCYSGSAFQHSHGLSVYFPWAKSDLDNDLPSYKELAFHKDTNWGAFLEAYGKETLRELRGNSGKSNYKSGKRQQLPMPQLDEIEIGVRINPQTDRSGRVKVVRVKNQPDEFYKYEHDCAGGGEK